MLRLTSLDSIPAAPTAQPSPIVDLPAGSMVGELGIAPPTREIRDPGLRAMQARVYRRLADLEREGKAVFSARETAHILEIATEAYRAGIDTALMPANVTIFRPELDR